jgi:hypothetical protein
MGGGGSKSNDAVAEIQKGGGAAQGPGGGLDGLTEEQRAQIHEDMINKRHTMLLLGTAGVGKSTISKQFVIAFGEGMTEEQIKAGANQVVQNIAQKISEFDFFPRIY